MSLVNVCRIYAELLHLDFDKGSSPVGSKLTEQYCFHVKLKEFNIGINVNMKSNLFTLRKVKQL